MEPVFIDLHIHTSENPEKLNQSYDLDLLKCKIEEIAEGSPYLISLTDHNTINKHIFTGKPMKNNLLILFAMLAMFTSMSGDTANTYRPKSDHPYITGSRGPNVQVLTEEFFQ